VPRPSSPLGTKASTRCPSCAAPAPSPKHAADGRRNRCQMTDGTEPDPQVSAPGRRIRQRFFPSSRLATGAQAPPLADARASAFLHTHAPGPATPTTDDGRTCFTVTTRFTMSTDQMTDVRGQPARHAPPPRHPQAAIRHWRNVVPMIPDLRRKRRQCCRRQPARPVTSAFCHLSSDICHLALVGLGRVERPTSRLSGVRSDQLSYRPKIRDQRTDDRRQTGRCGAGSVL
jgi:hypothetical protein